MAKGAGYLAIGAGIAKGNGPHRVTNSALKRRPHNPQRQVDCLQITGIIGPAPPPDRSGK